MPGERIELPTRGLQNRCSTTELTRQIKGLIPLASRFATRLPPLRWHFCSYSVRIRPKAASIYLRCPGVRIGEHMTICLLVQIGETGATSRFQSAPGKITAPTRAVPLSTQECLGLGGKVRVMIECLAQCSTGLICFTVDSSGTIRQACINE